MIRYERTGEWRQPVAGEYFEAPDLQGSLLFHRGAPCFAVPGTFYGFDAWILRRIEEPEQPWWHSVNEARARLGFPPLPVPPPEPEHSKPQPVKPERPETKDVLRALSYLRDARQAGTWTIHGVDWRHKSDLGDIDEAIRRVKVHEELFRLSRAIGSIGISRQELVAMLGSDGYDSGERK